MNNWITVPNFVTVVGIFLTIGYAGAFLSYKNDLVLPLLISASLTDFLDGFLARLLNQRSKVGFFLDPVRDKLLFVSIYFNLWFITNENPALYSSEISILLAGIATFEIRNAITLWEKGLPQPVHWLGKVRSFTHFFCGSVIVASHYIHWPLFSSTEAYRLLYPMLITSYSARSAYMLQPSRAEIKLEEFLARHQKLHAPTPKEK